MSHLVDSFFFTDWTDPTFLTGTAEHAKKPKAGARETLPALLAETNNSIRMSLRTGPEFHRFSPIRSTEEPRAGVTVSPGQMETQEQERLSAPVPEITQ